jgi:uncharacterized repeat protein (TIGR02543 family)
VNVVGNGSVTKNPNQTTYAEGTNVTLTAVPDGGWEFTAWSGDLTGSDNPEFIIMDSNKTVTATFTEIPPYIFEDGFESADFSAWTGNSTSAGESASVVDTTVFQGTYSAFLTSDSSATREAAYSYVTIGETSEIYVRGYVYVSQEGIEDNNDRFYFIRLRGGGNIAYAGWRQTGGELHWNIIVRDGTGWPTAYSVEIPELDRWYSVELHWLQDGTNGLGELYVDGVLVVSIENVDTDNFGGITEVQFGLPELYSCSATTVYADSFKISETYIGTES